MVGLELSALVLNADEKSRDLGQSDAGSAMTTNKPALKEELAAAAKKAAAARSADVLVFNFGLEPGFELVFIEMIRKRKNKRKSLLFFLTTEGGDPDTAYRMARYLQETYETITVCVPGWCKSAGTLMCIAGDELVIGDHGELGPLDIQIAKSDELWERSSGLAVNASFEKLQQESFSFFIKYLMDIKAESKGRITFRTAADIAAQVAIGVTSPIFSKLDPLTIGEDHRSNLVAGEYAIRLNLKPLNLKKDYRADGLEMLLRGYPSHGFVIDRKEASKLFKRASAPDGDLLELFGKLGRDMVLPRNASRNQPPRLEYLNDEDIQPSAAASAAPAPDGNARGGPKSGERRPGDRNVRRRISARAGAGNVSKPPTAENGPERASN